MTLNSWEAVYFDHDHDRIGALVDTAAALGVERVVLDDGWFLGRRDDTAGLGDWVVDPDVWPTGLRAVRRPGARRTACRSGVWVEPEMVNVDSDVVRAHPDWLLAPRSAEAAQAGRPGGALPWRTQQVLDLTRPEAFDHVLGQLDAMITAERPDYLKWDHNRDLHEAVTADGSAGVHRQTLAAYRLMDELQARHPGLEIESCSSGGARVDLGVLARTQRVWASDCNDALERQTHPALDRAAAAAGARRHPRRARPHSHTTGRVHDLDLRCLTAMFGHAGIEWDVVLGHRRGAGAPGRLDRPAQAAAAAAARRAHGARARSATAPGCTGSSRRDRDHAVYAFVRLVTGADAAARAASGCPGSTRRAATGCGRSTSPAGTRRGCSARANAQPAWCRGRRASW